MCPNQPPPPPLPSLPHPPTPNPKMEALMSLWVVPWIGTHFKIALSGKVNNSSHMAHAKKKKKIQIVCDYKRSFHENPPSPLFQSRCLKPLASNPRHWNRGECCQLPETWLSGTKTTSHNPPSVAPDSFLKHGISTAKSAQSLKSQKK